MSAAANAALPPKRDASETARAFLLRLRLEGPDTAPEVSRVKEGEEEGGEDTDRARDSRARLAVMRPRTREVGLPIGEVWGGWMEGKMRRWSFEGGWTCFLRCAREITFPGLLVVFCLF